MFTSIISLGLALLPFASAAVHDIQVGAGGKFEYYPQAIGAQPGDQVVFHFNPKNHTVTQSSFADPCGRNPDGFDSGFMPVAANQTDHLPTYTITVHDTAPIWVYCRQLSKQPGSHCGQGMVFAINCGPDGAQNSFTNFKQAALDIGASISASAAAAASATPTSGGYGGGYGGGGGGYGGDYNPDGAATSVWTAAYGDYTIPPAPEGTLVTQTVTLDASTWETTYTSYPGSPAPTPATLEGVVHKVIVGGPGKLAFDPPQISAKPRDIVVFEFHQKNHTVTQSSFADPCRKLDNNGVTGFDSDFIPVADDATAFPTWNLTINDTAPIWAYCRQKLPASHCGSGMVFAINSDETSARNFSAFQNVAEAINGTAAAAVASPAPTAPPSADANSAVVVKFGGAGMTAAAALLVAFLL
jgi:plastocyanin